eukprot:TRINITY_DN30246_c0_g1_i1.p1 TRINITY_DN30246_c0_g1~~TRINITY_DN30246_c0_g1_i1.p1  ORF type:complete len:1394 (-),score=280.24 TRINITY_DN30246_c0_g1_i1:389-4510(-)
MQNWFTGWGGGPVGVPQPATAGNLHIAPVPARTTLLTGTQPRLQASIVPSGTVANLGQSGPLRVGETVEYLSATQNRWIPASITAVNANGTYNLDCKPDVPREKIRRPAEASSVPSPGGTSGAHQTGDIVEYFGATQQKWITAKVLSANADGTYNLDCKPDVSVDRIRKPPRGDTTYAVGEEVEYFGATAGKWIPAKVLAANANGTYNLDCKPDVSTDRIRKSGKSSPADYKVGDSVEYFGATAGKWIPAKVLSVNTNGTYSLDCKPDVPPEKIRWPSSSPLGTGSALQEPPSAANAADNVYKEGDQVEYFGATLGKWIPAKVLKAKPSGTYDLDCKPDVPSSKIRWPEGGGEYKEGDTVEYFSATHNKWIPAKVLRVNGNGTYNLDCKPDVTSDKIRKPVSPPKTDGANGGAVHPVGEEVLSSNGVATYSVGEAVEYFGASQKRWIPAKVIKVNGNNTYDLDCKQQVQPTSIRQRANRSDRFVEDEKQPLLAPARTIAGLHAPVAFGNDVGGEGGADGPALAPIQLLRVDHVGGRWRYEVNPEGARALERQGGRQISVASICGLVRTGKTYLLNLLSERTQQGLPPFQVGGTARACTDGLWLWGPPVDEPKGSPLLAYIDCEGFAASNGGDGMRESQLMTLCALISSVMVLNTSGALNETVFKSLASSCRFADHVEERGAETSRPDLLWVIRDYRLDMQDEHGGPLTSNEYLEQALQSGAPGGQQNGEATREVRQSLLRFFGHRSCLALPRPIEDDAELRRLEGLPFSALQPEFRASVDKLRSSIVVACRAKPKAVGGQLLTCTSFVALLRHLTSALNDNRPMNLRGAWETVQHTTCGQLADHLRGQALQYLHAFAGGRPLPDGTQLPVTDDALRTALRAHRHSLKATWDERAVGDEMVRLEYWQELKESLAREEGLVRQQNVRLADQQLVDSLRAWQEWLDDDSASPTAVESICRELGQMMERMPAAPLSRAGRTAIDVAAKRVLAARQAITKTVEQHGEMQREAVAYGEQAAQQEGAARSSLEGLKAELQATKEQAQQRQAAEAALKVQQEVQSAELASAREQLEKILAEAEAIRVQEHDLKAKQRLQVESEAALQTEIEQARVCSAKSNADRLASERRARTAADAAAAEQRRLEVELDQARGEAERLGRELKIETDALLGENEQTRAEHQRRVEEARKQLEAERATLRGEKEKTRSEHLRMLEETRKQLDDERLRHGSAYDAEKDRQLERERKTGVLEGQATALSAEVTALRQRVHELEEKARQVDGRPAVRLEENKRIQADIDAARLELERANADTEARIAALRQDHERRIVETVREEERRRKAELNKPRFGGLGRCLKRKEPEKGKKDPPPKWTPKRSSPSSSSSAV